MVGFGRGGCRLGRRKTFLLERFIDSLVRMLCDLKSCGEVDDGMKFLRVESGELGGNCMKLENGVLVAQKLSAIYCSTSQILNRPCLRGVERRR